MEADSDFEDVELVEQKTRRRMKGDEFGRLRKRRNGDDGLRLSLSDGDEECKRMFGRAIVDAIFLSSNCQLLN